MKKRVTILFSGTHLSYSPTVIGLYDLLSKHFDVTILAESPGAFDFAMLTNRNVVYREKLTDKNRLRLYRRIFDLRAIYDKETAALKKMKFDTDVVYDFHLVRKMLAAAAPDFVIAVDFRNLLYAQILGKQVEFLSLEIDGDDIFYKQCDFGNVNSVIIQSAERYEYLFKDKEFKTFYVQNAPIYSEQSDNPKRENLVYCGTAWNPFGFYHCLEFLRKFPEFTLNVKGALLKEDKLKVETEYRDLISGGRLIIDGEYLDDGEVVGYLRRFRIGFCFYNFELERIDTFNYHSAPSGKMFKYMAAGVPVVGQDILGLQPVRKFDCGVLIKDLKPESIKKAIEKIEANFDYYSRNCLRAAAHYSFDKTTEPFIDYLTGK